MSDRTYFEQVPLDTVRKLLEKMPNSKKGMRPATEGTRRQWKAGRRAQGNQVTEVSGTARQEWPSQEDESAERALKYPAWQAPLHDVILEFNRDRLAEKAQKVEMLIAGRLQQLREEHDSRDEQEAIYFALSVLRGIKRDKLGYPDWQ